MDAERATTHDVDLSRTDAYDYPLPSELIARYPAARRDQSRLLVVPPDTGRVERSGKRGGSGTHPSAPSPDRSSGLRHLHFPDLPTLLAPGDLLVLNESRVLPVRLLGRKPTGAAAEVLLIRPLGGRDPFVWEALVRPGSKLKPGREVHVPGPGGEILRVAILDGLPGGARVVRLHPEAAGTVRADEATEGPAGTGRLSGLSEPTEGPAGTDSAAETVEAILERFGRIPLPPYLEREEEALDRERYQTVYARRAGSVAAPTAGLHFTPELLAQLEAGGVEVARVTLHVGPGTFRPVEAESLSEHRMHEERWEVSEETAQAVARAQERGGRIWAVGTTVVRTLESAADPEGRVRTGRGGTRLFISPGYRFRVVDALVTNFHLPRSTLLMLVSALAGHQTVMAAYREAVRKGYRFYSYGDAMVIPPGR